jgi:hypothetical protein
LGGGAAGMAAGGVSGGLPSRSACSIAGGGGGTASTVRVPLPDHWYQPI